MIFFVILVKNSQLDKLLVQAGVWPFFLLIGLYYIIMSTNPYLNPLILTFRNKIKSYLSGQELLVTVKLPLLSLHKRLLLILILLLH